MDDVSFDLGLILRIASLIFIITAISLIATAYNSDDLHKFLYIYQPLFIFSLFYLAIVKPILNFELKFIRFEEYSFTLLLYLIAIFIAMALFSVFKTQTIWVVPIVVLPFKLPPEQYVFAYTFMQYSLMLGFSPTIIASILLNFVVAFTESTTFQIALPDIFDILLPEKYNPIIRTLLTVVVPNFLFGCFHYFSYGQQLRNTVPAFISGAFLTLIYVYFSRRNIPCQSPLVDAHWLYNTAILLLRGMA